MIWTFLNLNDTMRKTVHYEKNTETLREMQVANFTSDCDKGRNNHKIQNNS